MKCEQFLEEIQVKPPTHLKQRILSNIKSEESKKAKIVLVFSSFGFVASFIAIFPAFIYLGRSLYQSGFFQYLSAIFSDGGIVLTYWKDYISLIVESAPLFEILSVLVVMFVLLLSLRSTIKNIKPALFNSLTV
jgi:hypothetical protein